jgi:outer membrane autotransporter protein
LKKLFFILAMLSVGVANANGFGALEYSGRSGVDGTADSTAYKVTIGTALTDNLKVDLSNQFRQNDGTNSNNQTRLESGLTYIQPVAKNLTAYGRVAVGEKFTTTNDFAYYSIEPGVKYAVTPSLSVRAAYRYRNAFNGDNADRTNTFRLGTEYAISHKYTVGLGFDRLRGDTDYNATNVILGMKF